MAVSSITTNLSRRSMAGLMAAVALPAVYSALDSLIEAHRATFAYANGPECDYSSPDPVIAARSCKALTDEETAMNDICAYVPQTFDEARQRAAYMTDLIKRGCCQNYQIEALIITTAGETVEFV